MTTGTTPSIKQAMILAAGKGTRMRPLTLTTPKPLVSVAGKPLIVWHIERLMQAGISDITINVGYLGEVLEAALLAMDLPVRLHISKEVGELLETAGGIKYALSQGLLKESPFLLINGDVWTEFDVSPLLTHHLKDKQAHLVLIDNPDHHPDGDFVLTQGQVLPKSEQTQALTFAGISVISPILVDSVQAGQVAPLAPLLRQAMLNHQVTGEYMQAKWVDVGTLERLAGLEAYLSSKV